ncbi:MAG: RHS repeat-associated core domain-containing protein [Rhizomicrobium sp.]
MTSQIRAGTDPEIISLTRALGNDPDKIYWWVRNNVRLTPMFGLQKGARGAAIDHAGTAFDQAHLMVEMLRTAGYAAQYKFGTITLTGAQFTGWFGIGDATAASQLLADGGIPAQVSASGATITSVTLMHVWVTTTIGGTSYAFDPSFKASTVTPGIDLAAAMGFSGGAVLSGALSGSQSNTTGGVAKVRHLDTANVWSTLQGYSTTLLAYLKANYPTANMDGIVGTSTIVTAAETPLRQTSLPYQTSVYATFANDIPNCLRTTLRLRADDIDLTLYADEIYAKPLMFQYSLNNAFYTGWQVALDGTIVAHGTTVSNEFVGKHTITADIDHPYAASGGTYMDDSVVQNLYTRDTPAVFTLGLGDMSSDFQQRMIGRSQGARGIITSEVCASVNGDPVTCSATQIDYSPAQRQRLGAMWLAQFSRLAQLSARVGGTMILHHHSLAIATLLPDEYGSGDGVKHLIAASNKLNIQSAVSVESLTNSDPARHAAIATLMSVASTLEGSVAEQVGQTPYPDSVAAKFDWLSRVTAASGADWIEYATPANWTAAKANLLADYCPQWIAPRDDTTFACTGATALVGAQADAYIQAGYSLVLPVSSFLGPGNVRDLATLYSTPNYTFYPNLERGGSLIGYTADDSHAAYVIVRSDQTDKGGGGTVVTNPDELFKPEANIVDKNGGVHALAPDIDLRSGTLSLTLPPDLVAGSGAAPYSLALQRTFRAGISGGWSTNWDSGASVSGDGLAAMGGTSPQAAAEFLVLLTALNDLSPTTQASDLDTLQHHVAAALANMWWAERIAVDTVELTAGADQKSFTRLADGSFLAPPGDASRLAGTVTRAFGSTGTDTTGQLGPGWYALPGTAAPVVRPTGTLGRSESLLDTVCSDILGDLSQYTFTLTRPDRSVLTFAYYCTSYVSNIPEEMDPRHRIARQGWHLTHIAYPSGLGVDLNYTDDTTVTGSDPDPSYYPLLTSVTNSVGRRLDFSYSHTSMTGALSVADNADPAHPRTVRFDGVDCQTRPFPFGRFIEYPCASLFGAAQDALGNTTGYDYLYQWPGGQSTDAFGTAFSEYLGDNLPWAVPAGLAAIHLPGSGVAADFAFTYDLLGRVQTAADAEGNVTQYWTANGSRAEVVDPLGGHSVSVYDPLEREILSLDALGAATTRAFDGLDRLTALTGPEGIAETYLYDARSNRIGTTRHAKPGSGLADLVTSATYHGTCNVPLTETDARGAVTTHTIDDATCLETAVTGPAVAGGNPVTAWTYNGYGQTLTQTDPTGLQTRYTYNGANYLSSVIAANGALNLTTAFGYDAAGNVTTLTDPRGAVHTAQYDADRQITEWDAPLGAVTLWSYDPTGLVLTVRRATGGAPTYATTAFTYWPTGKVHTTTDPDGSVTVSAHDALGRPSRTTDPMMRVVTTGYDAAGQVLVERRGVGSAVEIAYATHAWTPDGKEASVTDANGNKTAYAYDGFDRLAQTTYPAVTLPGQVDVLDFESFAYDPDGNATAHRLRGGGTVTSVFDALNRMTGRTVPAYGGQAAAVTTTTAYDLAGRETAVSDTLGNVIASAYDAAGRLSSTTQTIPGLSGTKTVSYQYDASSNRTRLTWPDGYYVQYGFDALNRMSTAAENGATTLATYSYDPLSRRTGLAYGNGASVASAYSAAGDLTSLVHDLLGTADDATTTLTYTPAHQLGRESVSNAAWDRSPPTTATVAYTPNGLNQYATVGGAGFVHDAQGNLTSDGARTFAYDAENRLLTATVAGTTTTYAYDPRGRRTARLTPTVGGPRWGTATWGAFPWTAALAGPGTTFFLDSGDDEIAELDPSGTVTRRFVPGPEIDEPIAMVTASTGAREYLHANHQGSIVATSDDTGALAEGPLTYDAYGACYAGATNTPCAATGIPYRFTGRRYDPETGLYYYRARYYDPGIGRFLQTDPVGYGDDLDWYSYVGNDPTNENDPRGLEKLYLGLEASFYLVGGINYGGGLFYDTNAHRVGTYERLGTGGGLDVGIGISVFSERSGPPTNKATLNVNGSIGPATVSWTAVESQHGVVRRSGEEEGGTPLEITKTRDKIRARLKPKLEIGAYINAEGDFEQDQPLLTSIISGVANLFGANQPVSQPRQSSPAGGANAVGSKSHTCTGSNIATTNACILF